MDSRIEGFYSISLRNSGMLSSFRNTYLPRLSISVCGKNVPSSGKPYLWSTQGVEYDWISLSIVIWKWRLSNVVERKFVISAFF